MTRHMTSGPMCSMSLSGLSPTTGNWIAPKVPMSMNTVYAWCRLGVKRPRNTWWRTAESVRRLGARDERLAACSFVEIES
jgi:hypothetical protein